MNPKPNKKLSVGAGSYVTIAWKGAFTQSQVLLSSIVGTLCVHCHPELPVFVQFLEMGKEIKEHVRCGIHPQQIVLLDTCLSAA